MKLIPLNKGDKTSKISCAGQFFSMVDDEDYDWLMKSNWHTKISNNGKNTAYAARWHRKPDNTPSGIKMHREIMGVTDPKIYVDHIDHNGLNNQKCNLRLCTHSQNGANRLSRKNSSSKYLGVCLLRHKNTRKDGTIVYSEGWCAKIRKNGKCQHIGMFKIEEDAAKAYDKKAKEIHGEFAKLNFPDI